LKIYKNSWFNRFADKSGITDNDLVKVIERIENGKIDADLGGGVIKQRIARQGQGRSKGYRAIILVRQKDKGFFVYGFSKSDKDNINKSDEREFKKLAESLLNMTDKQMRELLKVGDIYEVIRK